MAKTKLAAVTPLPLAPPQPPQAQPPKPQPRIKLLLSESDRWFVAQVLLKTPWLGGEAIVLAYNTLHETLKLVKVPLNKKPGELNRSAMPYTLPANHVDLLIRLLCGESGTGFDGIAGPMMAKLVIRIRAQLDKMSKKS